MHYVRVSVPIGRVNSRRCHGVPSGVRRVCERSVQGRKSVSRQALRHRLGITPSFGAKRLYCRGLSGVEVEPLQGVLDALTLPRYLEGVVPKGVAVRIRARAWNRGRTGVRPRVVDRPL